MPSHRDDHQYPLGIPAATASLQAAQHPSYHVQCIFFFNSAVPAVGYMLDQ